MIKHRTKVGCGIFIVINLVIFFCPAVTVAYTQPEEKRIDAVLLIGISESMKTTDSDNHRIDAAKAIIDVLDPSDQIGIVTF